MKSSGEWWNDWRFVLLLLSIPVLIGGYVWAFSISWRAAAIMFVLGLYARAAGHVVQKYADEVREGEGSTETQGPPESVEVRI